MPLEYADADVDRRVRRRTSMQNRLKIARDFPFVLAGLCIAFGLHAAEGRSLRLMPRISVGNADVAVPAPVLRGWEARAGFSLAPVRKTLSGAWIVDLPPDISPGRVQDALHALRGDPEILWVDDKAMAQRSILSGRAGTNRTTGQLAVRVSADLAARAMFAPGMTGRIAHHVIEDSAAYGSAGYTVERMLATGHALLRLDAPVSLAAATALAASLSKQTGVVYAEAVGRAVALRVPDDPEYVKQWGLSNVVSGINAPAAWDVTTGAPVTVGVIDTGILQHPDLAGKILPGFDFISDPDAARDGNGRDSDPTDPGDASTDQDECGAQHSSWHGTFVSGIIAAAANNGTGIAGVSWSAKILPVRVLGKCGGTFADVVDGMIWASGLPVAGVPANANPARILNMSLGGETGGCPDFLQEAIDAITARGAVVVVAAGNSQANVYDAAPAGCGGVIGVAAIGKSGDLTSYSNAGIKADIGAPGGDRSADPTESLILGLTNLGLDRAGAYGYGYGAGTSFSAPHVAGVLALMLSVNPDLTPGQMVSVLVRSARPYRQGTRCGAIIGNGECGAGMLDAFAALQLTPTAGNQQPAADLVTVVEFYNRFLRHYFLTAEPLEIDSIDAGGAGAGWSRTGYNFRAFSTEGAPADSNPVCRFYGTPGIGPNSHFYTAFPSECAYVQATDPGWTFEGLAFNAAMPEAGICRPGFKPVYRAYNGLAAVNDSNHRYTIDEFEYQRMLQLGWQPEGAVMCAVND
jgi:serine protease